MGKAYPNSLTCENEYWNGSAWSVPSSVSSTDLDNRIIVNQINENNKSLIEVVKLDNTDSTVELSDDEDSIAEVSQENDDDLEMEDCESNPPVQLSSDAFISEIAQNEEVSIYSLAATPLEAFIDTNLY